MRPIDEWSAPISKQIEQLDNDINFTQPVKEKRNIIMTKICKRCSKKEAEYCETCMNEENEQYTTEIIETNLIIRESTTTK